MRNTAFIVFVILLAATLTSCETVQGMGKDIQNLGSSTQRALSH